MPYIEAVPYDTDYICAKVALRPDSNMNVETVKRYSQVFWKLVADNMHDPKFKRIAYGNIGYHVMLHWKIKFLIQVPLLRLAKMVRKMNSARGQDYTKAFSVTRLLKVFKIYRALRKPAKQHPNYVWKTDQS